MDLGNVIGRTSGYFDADLETYKTEINFRAANSKVLIIGAAGSIGKAVTLEVLERNPKALHVVDISENNLVELVRIIRSSHGYNSCDFRTFALDYGSDEYASMFHHEGPYDYVFNLAALKHVRSESDPFTLMRLTRVNIFNTVRSVRMAKNKKLEKYFCVSTDKAARPVNLMGASKRIMEKFLALECQKQAISMARFANVAFSDGSLLHGFNQRIINQQPLSAPKGIKRYFITPKEAGQICLLSGFLAQSGEILFSKPSDMLTLTSFTEITLRFLNSLGYDPYICESEDEARGTIDWCISQKKWPVYFFESDTTGEKEYEEFFTEYEKIDYSRYQNIGIVQNNENPDEKKLEQFRVDIESLLKNGEWTKNDITKAYKNVLDDFDHFETGKYLDDRM